MEIILVIPDEYPHERHRIIQSLRFRELLQFHEPVLFLERSERADFRALIPNPGIRPSLDGLFDHHEPPQELDAAFAGLKEKKERSYGKREYLKPQTRFGKVSSSETIYRQHPFKAIRELQMGQPQICILCVKVGTKEDVKLSLFFLLGVPIMLMHEEENGHEELLSQASTKWQGFDPMTDFTPAIVRTLPDTQS